MRSTSYRDATDRAQMAVSKARAIKDEFLGKALPAEAAASMNRWLDEAKEFRAEAELHKEQEYWAEPQYKHAMTGGTGAYEDFGSGSRPGEFGKWIQDYALGRKSALVQDSTSGGLDLVPADYAGTILKELPRKSVIRNLATVIPTKSNIVDIGDVTIGSYGWGPLELAGSTTTDGLGSTPGDKSLIHVEDATALVKLGVNELEDSPGLEVLVRQALIAKFAEIEDTGFGSGTGHSNLQPYGIATRSVLSTGTITQGAAAATGETVTPDEVTNLMYAVPSWAQDGGVYLANSTVTKAAMLLKDSNGRYLWEEQTADGQPARWRGKPWYSCDGLPAMLATDDSTTGTNPSLIFGDFKQGYVIVDRQQIRVQRLVERYADEGKIGLLFTARVGGDVIRPKAFARLLL